jgi:putative endonuclease
MRENIKSQRGRKAEQRGRWGELICLVRLWLTGWRIVAHRLAHRRGTGLGEIDIVAKRGSVLAFIEVKARDTEAAALESITPAQRKRIQDAAVQFLAHRPEYANLSARFDAMVVSKQLWPRHIPDAWRTD